MPYLDGRILPTPNLRIFSFSELRNATRNFRIGNLLGEGRFGTVYKGWLDAKVTSKNGSGIVVAIKRMDYRDESEGSLEQLLFRRDSAVQPLPWNIRLKILIGAARGLAFLHALERPVICREFKASNILLDGWYGGNGVFGCDNHIGEA
ncbi:hypothetical protein C3L33_22671, partial [Rhododendron williamsianum]